MNNMSQTSSAGISLFFPVFNDEKTVRIVTEKARKVLSQLTDRYEIIIINDGSPDQSGPIADQLALRYPEIRVIHHASNLGYGVALQNGLKACQYDLIFFTDGDNEYDVYDIIHLFKLREFYDLIITFRYAKSYSIFRQIISLVYNSILRFLFRINYRDISSGMRMIHRNVLTDLHLNSKSPFIGAEIAIKTMLKGYRVGEVGIQTVSRHFGRSTSTSFKNIWTTIQDLWTTYQIIFSKNYDRSGRAELVHQDEQEVA